MTARTNWLAVAGHSHPDHDTPANRPAKVSERHLNARQAERECWADTEPFVDYARSVQTSAHDPDRDDDWQPAEWPFVVRLAVGTAAGLLALASAIVLIFVH